MFAVSKLVLNMLAFLLVLMTINYYGYVSPQSCAMVLQPIVIRGADSITQEVEVEVSTSILIWHSYALS